MRPRVDPPRLWMKSAVKSSSGMGIGPFLEARSHVCENFPTQRLVFDAAPTVHLCSIVDHNRIMKLFASEYPLWSDHFGKCIYRNPPLSTPLQHVELCNPYPIIPATCGHGSGVHPECGPRRVLGGPRQLSSHCYPGRSS